MTPGSLESTESRLQALRFNEMFMQCLPDNVHVHSMAAPAEVER